MIFNSIITQNERLIPENIFANLNLSSNIQYILGDNWVNILSELVGEKIQTNTIIKTDHICKWIRHLEKTEKMNHPIADLLIVCKDNYFKIKFYSPSM